MVNKIFSLFIIILLAAIPKVFAQISGNPVILPLLPGEQWWGGTAHYGRRMPLNKTSSFSFNLYGDISNNQSSPLLLSNKGRWVWSDDPFSFTFSNDTLHLEPKGSSPVLFGSTGKNLSTAYRYASSHFFPATGQWPDSLLVTAPQYNLWIELQYNPNEKDVLEYAEKVKEYGFPAGVLMIDDNWSNYYGEFEFNKEKFPDARKAIDKLHAMGFKVMLWICPFISPDSDVFRDLERKKLLLLDSEGDDKKEWMSASKPLLIKWWNGYSACLDLTNPNAKKWLSERLSYLQEKYGVDGFKLDAGDPYFYNDKNLLSYKKVSPNDHCMEWANIGLQFPLNEYRAMWKMGGMPLVQRLADKNHSWKDLQTLIPNTVVQQLMGYTFTCPDMIGGGAFTSFLPGMPIDQKLIVRSAQVHALMPMMQFSVAPWRILDSLHLQAIKDVVNLRQRMLPTLMQIMRLAVKTGEPSFRSIEYNYPGRGYENIKDEFMMGTDILVAPVVTERDERMVVLPPGDWYYLNKIWKGGKTYRIQVPLNELPFFILQRKNK